MSNGGESCSRCNCTIRISNHFYKSDPRLLTKLLPMYSISEQNFCQCTVLVNKTFASVQYRWSLAASQRNNWFITIAVSWTADSCSNSNNSVNKKKENKSKCVLVVYKETRKNSLMERKNCSQKSRATGPFRKRRALLWFIQYIHKAWGTDQSLLSSEIFVRNATHQFQNGW